MRRRPILLLSGVALTVTVGMVLWTAPWDRITRRTIERYLRDIEARVPIRFERFEPTVRWGDLKKGRLTNLALTVRWQNARIELDGPLRFSRNGAAGRYEVVYETRSRVTFTGASSTLPAIGPLPLRLEAAVSSDFKRVLLLDLEARLESYAFPPAGLKFRGVEAVARWENGVARTGVKVHGIEWTDPAQPNRMAQIQSVAFSGEADLTLDPFTYGPRVKTHLSAGGGELLLGDFYLDLPLKELPVSLDARLITNTLD